MRLARRGRGMRCCLGPVLSGPQLRVGRRVGRGGALAGRVLFYRCEWCGRAWAGGVFFEKGQVLSGWAGGMIEVYPGPG